MRYVYLLRSINEPSQTYVGLTSDLRNRIRAHNQGLSPHTAKFRPWRIVTYIAFSEEEKAARSRQSGLVSPRLVARR